MCRYIVEEWSDEALVRTWQEWITYVDDELLSDATRNYWRTQISMAEKEAARRGLTHRLVPAAT